MAGNSSISPSTAYPSLLEDSRVEYKVTLTEDRLPHLEEIHIRGPTQEDMEIQVTRRASSWGSCVHPFTHPLIYSAGIWGDSKGPVLGAHGVPGVGEGERNSPVQGLGGFSRNGV